MDNEKVFPDVFRLFEEWREAEGLTGTRTTHYSKCFKISMLPVEAN